MSRAFLAVLILAAALPTPAVADVKAGVDAWSAGDYEAAVGAWRAPALAGDPDAQFNLGQAYRLGRGVPANLDIALDWFRKAAAPREGGIIHEKAATEYGLTLFQTGRREDAMPYVQAAAQRGDPRAQYVLGTSYFNGKLIEKDWVRGYANMSRAAAAGLPAAQRSLEQMDSYITEPQKREALAMAQTMAAASRNTSVATGFQVGQAAPPTSVRPVDLPASNSAGTSYDPSGTPVMASAAQPIPQPAVQPIPQVAPQPAPQTIPAATSPQAMPQPEPRPAPVLVQRAAPAPAAPDVIRAAESTDIPGYVPSAPLRAPAAAEPSPAPAQAARPAAKAATAAAPAAKAAHPAASGDWRVQLGAFSTEARARALFDRLGKKLPGLQDTQPFLVDAGKVTRLQIGPFASQSAAEAMCAKVKRAGNGCFALRK